MAAFAAAPSPISAITLEDNVSHVIDVVQRVHLHGPVMLIGHSLGIRIRLVGNAIPEAIHRIVYISAFCPSTPEGPCLMALSQTSEATQGISVLNLAAAGEVGLVGQAEPPAAAPSAGHCAA